MGLFGKLFGKEDKAKPYISKASPQSLERATRNVLSDEFGAYNIETALRIIDGSNGAIASGDFAGDKVYNAMYNVKTGPSPRHLVCSIFSDYPWEEGTLTLFKTLHIERNATA
jgi:hypothetical protein